MSPFHSTVQLLASKLPKSMRSSVSNPPLAEGNSLTGIGHLNLLTTFGPIDLLAAIGKNLTYGTLYRKPRA